MIKRGNSASRLLIPTSAWLWGLQFAFLNPALALILVSLYDATPAQVGWVLAVYNASGFVASLVLPVWADRRSAYLRLMVMAGALTMALAVLLWLASTLPVAVIGLVVLGGPAGVGASMLYAHLRHSGAPPTTIVNTRAIVSVAWIAGPPLATLIIGVFGDRAILVAIAVVALLNVATTAALIRHRKRTDSVHGAPTPPDDHLPMPRSAVALLVGAFVLLQATNAASVSVMNLFVTETLGLNVMWAGIALGVSAALEIPALLLIGKANQRYSSIALIATGCVAGIGYYIGMVFVTGPALLLGLQALNAWFFAAVAGIGITLFQQVIPQPGIASGLFTNTRRVGAIVSGALIGLASTTALGYAGIYVASAALTVIALLVVGLAGRLTPRTRNRPSPA